MSKHLRVQELRRKVDSDAVMLTRKLHYQGYEYQSPFTGRVLELILGGESLFPTAAWPNLTGTCHHKIKLEKHKTLKNCSLSVDFSDVRSPQTCR